MELNVDAIEHGNPLGLGTSIILLSFVLILLLQCRDTPVSLNGLPLINGKRRFEFVDLFAKKRFITNAQDLLKAGLKKVGHPRFAVFNGYLTASREVYSISSLKMGS